MICWLCVAFVQGFVQKFLRVYMTFAFSAVQSCAELCRAVQGSHQFRFYSKRITPLPPFFSGHASVDGLHPHSLLPARKKLCRGPHVNVAIAARRVTSTRSAPNVAWRFTAVPRAKSSTGPRTKRLAAQVPTWPTCSPRFRSSCGARFPSSSVWPKAAQGCSYWLYRTLKSICTNNAFPFSSLSGSLSCSAHRPTGLGVWLCAIWI